MKNIVILISGRGSNMQAIVNAKIPQANIAAVLSNSDRAAGLAWAAEHGIPTDSLNHKSFDSRLAFDQAMMAKIDAYQPDLVVLAGFMRILTPEFCAHYEGRLINIHPSILPSFTGLHTHQRAFHFVTAELDCGPIISQGVVPILDQDTADDIAARVLTVEHRLFPQAVADFIAGHLKIEGNRVLNTHKQTETQALLA